MPKQRWRAKTKKENRTQRITIRLTKPEYAFVKEEIEICGLTMAWLARKRLLGERIASKADLAVLAELRRLGGLFKHSYTETGGIYSELTAQAIRDISAYVRALTEKRSQTTTNPEGSAR